MVGARLARTGVEAGLERPLFWGPDGTRTRFGDVEELPPDEPVQHVLLLRGRGLRRLGGRAAAHRGGVGEGGGLGPGDRPAAPLPVGRRGADAGPGQPRRRRAAPGAGGRLPGRGVRLRRRAADRRRLGVDVVGVPSRGPGFRPMLYADYSRAVLRRRLPGAARRLVGGRRPSILRPSASATGTYPVRRQIFSGLRLAWDA